MANHSVQFPVLRWVGLAWLAVWVPCYARGWGWANFLHICDVAIFLTVLGIWVESPLLLSSQAVAVLVPDAAWCLDAGWHVVFGHALIGGTEYMWDPKIPLFLRLLSLYHLLLPVVLIWAVARTGYDRRGLWYGMATFAAALVASRAAPALQNINFAYLDPFLRRSWGPAPIHLAVVLAGATLLGFLPTDLALRRLTPPRAER
ncbi:MAG TPA: hypothetical protein VEH50_06575 [Methylomirabilota bacterium]|jgi:hypothetical protein|nr:hypothetical protein [Methylomirabilota bacterium]